jgi:hypothetical protein
MNENVLDTAAIGNLEGAVLPRCINGYPVLRYASKKNWPDSFVILVHRSGMLDCYVTALWHVNNSGREWYHGRYFSSFAKACQDFNERTGW